MLGPVPPRPAEVGTRSGLPVIICKMIQKSLPGVLPPHKINLGDPRKPCRDSGWICPVWVRLDKIHLFPMDSDLVTNRLGKCGARVLHMFLGKVMISHLFSVTEFIRQRHIVFRPNDFDVPYKLRKVRRNILILLNIMHRHLITY